MTKQQTTTQPTEIAPRRSILVSMATRYNMEPEAFERTMRATVFPGNGTKEQFAAFLVVAHEYQLNPLTREIYAFPAKGGGVMPIVSVDGWSSLLNREEMFDGVEFTDHVDEELGDLISVTASIHRRDRGHPTIITEYMAECRRDTEPWKKWPRRMLRHKALIQCARYAFGYSGIYDPDEAERVIESQRQITDQRRPASVEEALNQFAAEPTKKAEAKEEIVDVDTGEITEPAQEAKPFPGDQP